MLQELLECGAVLQTIRALEPLASSPHLGDLQVSDVQLECPNGCLTQNDSFITAFHLQSHKDMCSDSVTPAARQTLETRLCWLHLICDRVAALKHRADH